MRRAVSAWLTTRIGEARTWSRWILIFTAAIAAACSKDAPTETDPAAWEPPSVVTFSHGAQDAFGVATECMEDVTEAVEGSNAVPLECTANDLNLFFTIPGQGQETPVCLPEETLPDLQVEAHFAAGASERFDLGLWIRDDNQPIPNALRGDCRHWSLVPVDDAETPEGEIREAPFYDGDGDTCGDTEQDIESVLPITLTGVICQDTDEDGQLDIGACVSYDNNGNSAHSCTDPHTAPEETIPNTKSKCACGPLNLPVNIAGKIIIEKQTIPDGDTEEFDFTGTGPDGNLPGLAGTIGDGETIELVVEAGQYTSTEAAETGWDLTSIVCDDENSTEDVATRTATINVETAETVTCVFTNTEHASVDIEKQSFGGTETFDYTATGAGITTPFTRNTATNNPTQSTPFDISAANLGTKYVQESAETGWTLTDINCTANGAVITIGTGQGAGFAQGTSTDFDAGDNSVKIELTAGDTPTCTFENTRDGSIKIVKDAQNPATDPEDFSFTATGTGMTPSPFTLDDDGDNVNAPTNEITFGGLQPNGARTVTEGAETEWDLTAINCTGATSSTVTPDVANRQVSITLAAGENIVCTFVNKRKAKLIVDKVVVGGGTQSFDFTVNPGTITFALTDAATPYNSGFSLGPNTYTVCELDLAVSWSATATVEGVNATLTNPDAPQDLGNRCLEVILAYGDTKTVVWTNTPPPGGDARTIGYWKNWSECTGGKQFIKATAPGGVGLGATLDGNLPIDLLGDFGTYNVTTCAQAVKILSKQDQSGKSMGGDAAYILAAQLLAAELNVKAFVTPCTAASDAIEDGQILLGSTGGTLSDGTVVAAGDAANFNGSGTYWKGGKNAATLRAKAIEVAAILDSFNNNTLCGP